MSFQDRTQHQINQIDKEVCTFVITTCNVPKNGFLALILGVSQFRLKKLIALKSQLSKYPMLNNLEKQTSVPKVYAFLGLVGVYFFLIFFNIGGEFLVNIAGFVIPGYYSMEALFTSGSADDTQVGLWLLWTILKLLA